VETFARLGRAHEYRLWILAVVLASESAVRRRDDRNRAEVVDSRLTKDGRDVNIYARAGAVETVRSSRRAPRPGPNALSASSGNLAGGRRISS
jgi:hypothetical protein